MKGKIYTIINETERGDAFIEAYLFNKDQAVQVANKMFFRMNTFDQKKNIFVVLEQDPEGMKEAPFDGNVIHKAYIKGKFEGGMY